MSQFLVSYDLVTNILILLCVIVICVLEVFLALKKNLLIAAIIPVISLIFAAPHILRVVMSLIHEHRLILTYGFQYVILFLILLFEFIICRQISKYKNSVKKRPSP